MGKLSERYKQKKIQRLERRLIYCYDRCLCGALYAYDPKNVLKGDFDTRERKYGAYRAWDCSDIILGLAIPKDQEGSVKHGDIMPFVFWKVKKAPTEWALANRKPNPTLERGDV